ncbi:polycomb group protein EMBRYONIC FLOWER 2-like isoform X2 [Cynara cardunculus var. scolymus]|uniref:polycomb group protein EMBRYONIC FLOWER 2-like isoform X2 n=1 Tax=Cynara cardunculus var. scolymus TaxID=59895 RepID=UPI000D624628|nr:polycomb group protein EMBRYONIC FLOWER 2-like isoform X2 [Cynara cardunculus var. scolymus]
MPGISLVARETTYSRGSDQMCRHEARVQLSPEEQTAAEESLSVYCKPVELYNILQRRAVRNPSFLQRCLHYKLQAKQKRRIQISVSISGATNDGPQTQSLFPLYILLARLVSTTNVETQCTAVYRFSRVCKLMVFGGDETSSSARAKFILPEMSKLSMEVKSGSLAVLLVRCADTTNLEGIDLTEDHMFSTSLSRVGYCSFGKIPIDLLHSSWQASPTLSLGGRAEMISTVIMQTCYMKLSCLDGGKCVSFHFPYNSEALQVPVIICAEEAGVKNMSPYDMYSYNDTPRPGIMRLRSGNVIFNYKYYNNMLQRTEVTEDFSCPFCLVKCASYKGLRFHLTSSHDLFHYEFWVTEDYQVVIVSMRTDVCNSEIIPDNVDPKQQMFFYCYKSARRRKPKCLTQNANHVHPLVLDSAMPANLTELIDNTDCVPECMERDTYSPDASATGHSFAEPESVQSVPGSNLGPPAMLQFAKTRKLSIERSDPRNRALLQKRQFFHSHRAQPMALEQVFAERDSEDEVDDDVADLEDRRMLDDFVDVSKDEKQMMHLWNSFVRKQRVLADGHIPWACEAFSKLHGPDLVQSPSLLWCWRLFMIKIWNHGLVESRTLNNCNMILEQYQTQYMIDPNLNPNPNPKPIPNPISNTITSDDR